jgi:tetratricopeptide (TPR) repeat protein
MTHTPVFDLSISGPVICLACSEDGTKIAVGDRNGNLTLVDKAGNILWEKHIDEGIHGLAIVGNGNKIICGGKDCKVRMFNSLGNIEWEQTIGKSIWSLSVDPNGQFIGIGTGDSIALYTESGLKVWEYSTNRAMVGTGISRNGSTIVGCGDEHLYCLDNEGNLKWKKQRSDSLWDVSVDKDGNNIFVGGWDEMIHGLDSVGNDLWNYKTGGYVRAVNSLENGGIIAGSHDNHIYHLSDSGELLEEIETEGEVTCVCVSKQIDFIIAGTSSNKIYGFEVRANTTPINQPNTETNIEDASGLPSDNIIETTASEEEYEPMFGAGMFDEPIPDTTGILDRNESSNYKPENASYEPERSSYEPSVSNSNTYDSNYSQRTYSSEGGEYKEFASEIVKTDVKNYLRLGNAAWVEKRLERAAEHYKRATEIDSDEPRAWHNLAICSYHLALKRNPENIKGAVQSAYAYLEIAKEKGGKEYTAPDKTITYFATQLDLI